MAIFVAENGRQARLQTINNNHNKNRIKHYGTPVLRILENQNG